MNAGRHLFPRHARLGRHHGNSSHWRRCGTRFAWQWRFDPVRRIGAGQPSGISRVASAAGSRILTPGECKHRNDSKGGASGRDFARKIGNAGK